MNYCSKQKLCVKGLYNVITLYFIFLIPALLKPVVQCSHATFAAACGFEPASTTIVFIPPTTVVKESYIFVRVRPSVPVSSVRPGVRCPNS